MNDQAGSWQTAADSLNDMLRQTKATALFVGFSGGIDSVALLHWLKFSYATALPLTAVHVHHGLHTDSGSWAQQCAVQAERWQIPFQLCRVQVETGPRISVEAAARDARYQALANLLPAGAVLLTAHHRRDQAEGMLLALKRGSGPAGLAAMPLLKPFAQGWHVRPLLGLPKTQIERYARQHHLTWLDDPSNDELRYDRNFIRHQLLPLVEQRWPAFVQTVTRSARLCGEQQQLADEVAALDYERCRDGHRLRLADVSTLSLPRRYNLLRYWVRRCGAPVLTETQLHEGWQQMSLARQDALPVMRWQGWQWRRYRLWLYLEPELGQHYSPAFWQPEHAMEIAGQMLCQRPPKENEPGCCWPVGRPLRIVFQPSGCRFKAAGKAHSRLLKQWWKEQGIPPWQRAYWPVLCDEQGNIVQIPGLAVAADYAAGLGEGWLADWSPNGQ